MSNNYRYHKVNQQSFFVRFQFRKSRAKGRVLLGTPDTQRTHDGIVQFLLTINKVKYGPYCSSIRTFHSIWEGRQASRITEESKALTRQLIDFQTLIEEVHCELTARGSVIDGQTILNGLAWYRQRQTKSLGAGALDSSSPFDPVTLTRVYQEFMGAKIALIEPNRRKRKEGQISKSTYETYPRRWALINGYLRSIKSSNQLVLNINYAFATNLKEWLVKQPKIDGTHYDLASINKVISFLKMLMGYSLSKGYIEYNPLLSFACRGGSAANPKPLTEQQLAHLEACELPPMLRHICDSWLVAAELCLHHADFMELPDMPFIQRPKSDQSGTWRFIQHDRRKQTGSSLLQTVNVTDRAERILDRWGVKGLYYRSSAQYSKYLKVIARIADLRDSEGELIGLQFGQGRDSGLTQRAIDGANNTQLAKMAGWTKASYADRYVGNAIGIVEAFVQNKA